MTKEKSEGKRKKRMKKMWKRILSLLLAFEMVFSMAVPSYAESVDRGIEMAEDNAIKQESEFFDEEKEITIQDTTAVNFTEEEENVSATSTPEFSESQSIETLEDSDVSYSSDDGYFSNKYLSLRTFGNRFNLATKEGNIYSETDNEQWLLSNYPSSDKSEWRLSISGYMKTVSGGTPQLHNGVLMTSEIEIYGGISARKTFRFVKSKTTGKEDVVEIAMTVTNNGSSDKKVGARIALDTSIAGKNRCDFYLDSKGIFDTAKIYSNSIIPQQWQAMDDGNDPTVTAYGMFYQKETDKPDRVYFGNFSDVNYSHGFIPTVEAASYITNSGVAALWLEKPLSPGESRTYTTWIGVGQMAPSEEKDVSLTINAESEGTVAEDGQGYEPIEIVSSLQNNGSCAIEGLRAELVLPEGLTLSEGEQSVHSIESLGEKDTTTALWHVISQPVETGADYTYSINIIDSEGITLASGLKDLKMPKLDMVAPVLLGNAQVQNRASESAEIILPTATDANGVKSYRLVCEELGLDQTVDAGNQKTVSGKISERITGLLEGKIYEIQITAEDIYGNISEVKTVNISAVQPSLFAQSKLTLGGRKTDATLQAQYRCDAPLAAYGATWKPIKSGVEQPLQVTTYKRNGNKYLSAQWDISALESGDYEVVFSITEQDGKKVSATTVCTIDNTPPSAVTDVKSQADAAYIHLSWNRANEEKVKSYRIYRGQGDGDMVLYHTITSRNTVQFIDLEVLPDVSYRYYVTAVDQYDMESEASEIVQSIVKKTDNGAVSFDGYWLKNKFLSINLSNSWGFAIKTIEGNTSSETDNEQMLWGDQSKWLLSVNGNAAVQYGERQFSDGAITYESEYRGINCKRTYRLVKSKTPGNTDVVEISMTVINNGSTDKKVGARVALAAAIAGKSQCDFYVDSKGAFDTAKIFSKDHIPQHWQAMDDQNNPTVVSQGMFYRRELDKPDKVYFADSGALVLSSSRLEPLVEEGTYSGGSAVSAAWLEKPLAPGESRTYTTWVGVGKMSPSEEKDVSLSVDAESEGTISKDHYGYEPVEVIAYIQNHGTSSLQGLKAELVLPEGLTLSDGEQSIQILDSLAAGDTKSVSWHVISPPVEAGTDYTYTINIIDPEEITLASISKDIKLPEYDLIAPVLAGDARVQNRASASAEILLPTATDNNGIKRYRLVCEELNLDQTVDAENQKTVSGKISERITGLLEGKSYEVHITAEDIYGNISEAENVSILGFTPTLAAPENRTFGGRKTDIELWANTYGEDTQAVYSACWKLIGSSKEHPFQVIIPETYPGKKLTVQWDISALESDDYEVIFSVTDRDGKKVSATTTCTIDNTLPSVVTNVTAQADYNSVHLSWHMASEYKVKNYRIYRGQGDGDMELYRTISSRSTVSYDDKEVVPDVSYRYYVTAVDHYDMESEVSEIVQIVLVKDEEAPQVTSLTPANGTTLSGKASFCAKAQDNLGVASVEIQYRQGTDGEWNSLKTGTATSCTADLDTATMEDGKIQVRAIAVDISGNTGNGTPVYTYLVDNTGPAKVTDLSYTSTSATITLAWKYVMENDFDHFVVEEKIDDVFAALTEVRDTLGVNLPVKPRSSHVYRVYGVDKSGNRGEVSEEILASAKVDFTVPIVSAISPKAGYHNEDFTVSFTMKDDDAVAGAKIQISTDRTNWTTVEEVDFAEPSNEAATDYRVQISDYEDGSIYVRAIPMDASENWGTSNNATAPFAQYILDRIPPAVPSGVSVSPSGAGLQINWDNDSKGETEVYRLLRSESQDGTYGEVASNLKTIHYYDRTAKADVTYWYKVQAGDFAGNWSGESTAVSGSWAGDTITDEKPQILSIGPAVGSVLGGTTKSISVLAQDDQEISRIEISYRKDGVLFLDGEKHTITLNGNGSYYLNGTVAPDLSLYKSGDKLEVSAIAFDANNNQSEPVKVTYTIDVTAPSISDLNVESSVNGETSILTWAAGKDSEDLNGYYVYRSSDHGNSWTKIGTRGRRDDNQYRFEDVLSNSGTYVYKVTALDMVGNQSDTKTDPVTYNKPKRIVADFVTDNQQENGVEYLFDAKGSFADNGIESYLFNFGDGKTSEQMQAVHKYEKTGIYTVTLTVGDKSGKTSETSQIVEVKEQKALGKLTVSVVDDSGVPVNNAPVYFDMGTDEQVVKYTDGSGNVTFTNVAGRYTVGAYMDQYLPVTKQIIVPGGSQRQIELVMVKQPVVTGKFAVNRMTLDEIKAAGIDLSNPANQNCIQMTVRLTYGGQEEEINVTRNSSGSIIGGSDSVVIGDKQFQVIPLPDFDYVHRDNEGSGGDGDNGNAGGDNPGGGNGNPGGSGNANHAAEDLSKVIAIMELPVNASGLKEFFDAKLHILNNASEAFTLEDNSISLNLPDGLQWMMQSQNCVFEVKDNLPGQSQWTLSWILRGEEAGDYDLSVDYNGTLAQFNAPVAATFKTGRPIHVYGMDAYKLIVDVNSAILYGGLYFNLSLQNISDVDLYMPNIDIADNIIRTLEMSKGEEEKPTVTVRNVSITNSQGYVQYLGSKGTVDTLAAKETLTKQYLLYNAITSEDIARLKEATYEVANGLGIQVEINSVNMDLYSSANADEKFDSIMKNPAKGNAYGYLTDCSQFYYYQQALSDKNLAMQLGQAYYNYTNAVLNLDWDNLFGHDDERKIARQFIYELLQDESFQQAVDEKIDNTYFETAKGLIECVVGTLEVDFRGTESEFETIVNLLDETNNIHDLSNALKTGGTKSFEERIGTMVGSSVGAVATVSLKVVIENELFLKENYSKEMLKQLDRFNEDTKGVLETVGKVIGAADETITAWNDSVELTNQLVTINAVQDQAFLLTDLILQNDHIKGTETYKEVQEIQRNLKDGFNQQQLFFRELVKKVSQQALSVTVEAIIECVDTVFCAGTLKIIRETITIVYNTADNIFGLKDTANIYTTLKVSACLTLAMKESTEQTKEVAINGDSMAKQQFLGALKYLIKMRLVGERTYLRMIPDYSGINVNYRPEKTLEQINSDKGENFETLEEYYLWFKEKVLKSRDCLYDEIIDNQEQPEAPEVTIDYIGCRTFEKFDNNYEYSFDNELWRACGTTSGEEDHLYLYLRPMEQVLYVRHKASEDGRVGKTTVVQIKAQRNMEYATFAGKLGEYSVIRGLKENCTYQVVRAEQDIIQYVNWSKAVTVTSDQNGQVVAKAGTVGDYVFYRLPAETDEFPSVAHSIDISRNMLVKVSASVQGSGRVQCEGIDFTSKILIRDEALTLNAVYDNTKVAFLGWYQNEELYSTKDVLELDTTESLDLTAKFESLPQYTLTVSAGEGGKVIGGGIAYKGTKLTAKAIADTGYTFQGWKNESGLFVGVNSTRTVTMMEDVSLTAVFEKLPTARVQISMDVQDVPGMEKPAATVTISGQDSVVITPDRPFDEKECIQNTSVTVTANDSKDATFVNWQAENGMVVSRNRTFTFRAEEYTHYIATYKVAGQSVIFVSSFGYIQSNKQYPASVTADSITLENGVTRIGYDFIGWRIGTTTYPVASETEQAALKNAILSEIQAGRDVILNAVYEQQLVRYKVTVINGTGGGTYDANAVVTVTSNKPEEGMNFAGWYEGETLLTTNRSYSFYVLADRTLTAKYTENEVEEVGTTRIETVSANKSTKKISFVSMSSVPNSCKIQKAGVIATANGTIGNDVNRFTVATATYVRYGTTSAKNYRYTWTKGNVTAGQTWYVRAYLVYTDANGNSHTIYGNIVAANLNGVID